jgi:hypothetical protein
VRRRIIVAAAYRGIDAGLRHRSVRAASEPADLQTVAGEVTTPARPPMVPDGPDHHVLAEHDVGLGKASKSPSSIVA